MTIVNSTQDTVTPIMALQRAANAIHILHLRARNELPSPEGDKTEIAIGLSQLFALWRCKALVRWMIEHPDHGPMDVLHFIQELLNKPFNYDEVVGPPVRMPDGEGAAR